MSQADILRSVIDERKRQDERWGKNRNHHPFEWLGFIVEEVGELAEAINETVFDNPGKRHLGGSKNIKKEAIQVAALVIALLESIERNR